jgi:hypothetical protein
MDSRDDTPRLKNNQVARVSEPKHDLVPHLENGPLGRQSLSAKSRLSNGSAFWCGYLDTKKPSQGKWLGFLVVY